MIDYKLLILKFLIQIWISKGRGRDMKPPMQVNAKNKTRLANIRKEHQEFESINDQNRNPNVLMQPGGLRPRK